MSTGTKRRSCGRILRARKALGLLPAVRMCATSHAMSNFSVPTCPVRLAFVREGARSLYAGQLEPATAFSAGIDLRACLDEDCVRIPAGGRFCVPAGISVQPCEAGFAGFLYSRSGLGARAIRARSSSCCSTPRARSASSSVVSAWPSLFSSPLSALSGRRLRAFLPRSAVRAASDIRGASLRQGMPPAGAVRCRVCRGHIRRRAGTFVFPAGLPFFPKPFLFHDCRGACPVGWRKASQQRS